MAIIVTSKDNIAQKQAKEKPKKIAKKIAKKKDDRSHPFSK